MQTRRIGSLDVSEVGLGCNNFGGPVDGPGTDAVVAAALEAGINFFDTADIYGGTQSEVLVGRALAGRRDEVVVATKFGVPYGDQPGGGSPAYVQTALEASLRRLGVDHVDLYQLHFPDPKVPVAETLGAMGELVTQGKVREIGCSNFTAALLAEAAGAAAAARTRPFASVQNEYSILNREPEKEVLAECARSSTAFLPYFPLASGLLTGKYRPGQPAPAGSRLARMEAERQRQHLSDERLEQVRALGRLAEGEGHTTVELAIAWLLSHGEVASVIAGATTADQVRANAAGAGWTLDAGLVARVDEIAPA